MKRPRQSAARQNAGPLALFGFVVNVTASFFRQFSRHISTWEKELNRRRQTLKPLENQGFFRLSLLYRNGILLQLSCWKRTLTSDIFSKCSVTVLLQQHRFTHTRASTNRKIFFQPNTQETNLKLGYNKSPASFLTHKAIRILYSFLSKSFSITSEMRFE